MEQFGAFKRYVLLAGKNLRYNSLPNLLAAAALVLLLPMLFSLRELSAQESAVPLELGLSLLGIILITPAFMPEAEEGIRDTVSAKYTSCIRVCALRSFCGAVIAALFTGFFIVMLKAGGCAAGLSAFWGTFSNILFLGGLGLLSHALVNQGLAGYMVPTMYYAFNLSGAKAQVGPFYLFSMMTGETGSKLTLFLAGLAAASAALFIRQMRMRQG